MSSALWISIGAAIICAGIVIYLETNLFTAHTLML